VNPRPKILALADSATGALLGVLVLGSVLCFGGAVWWFRPVMVAAAFLLVAIKLAATLGDGRMPFLKSPLGMLGLFALLLGILQLVPLPASLASRLSSTAHETYTRGLLPRMVQVDLPEAILPEAPPVRSPASLDRAATLQWLVQASACLGIFWAVSHYTDRLNRLYLVWGLVVAAFFLNATLAVVQISGRSQGLYGLFVPGAGPAWAPSLSDLMESPGTAVLRNQTWTKGLGRDESEVTTPARAVLVPVVPALFGTMMASSGALLALGTLALPLTLAIILHVLSPRGSRESLGTRLGDSSQGSLVLLLSVLTLLGVFLIGLVAGAWYSLPVALGLLSVGLPAVVRPPMRWPALGLLTLLLVGLATGVTLQAFWPLVLGGQAPVQPPDLDTARSTWSESLRAIREFPLVGSGLGSFATIHAYFKDRDLSSSTAMSSLLQWGVETGAAGAVIVATGVLWCLLRLPGGLKRVGSIDRSLAHGFIGAALSFGLLAAVHWTVELSAVAISASALGGTWNRWLAGGTDLFVERG
jgi:hypothetical protein